MAFIRKKVTSYKWPLVLHHPNNGEFELETVTVIFKRLGESRISELQSNAAILGEAIYGYVDSDSAKEVQLSAPEIKDLLDDVVFLRAAVKGFFESIAGAKEGN